VKLDGPAVDYEATMTTKLQLVGRMFDAAGHKSLQTQGYKVGAMPLLYLFWYLWLSVCSLTAVAFIVG